MARFKIELLTALLKEENSKDTGVQYLRSVVSEFSTIKNFNSTLSYSSIERLNKNQSLENWKNSYNNNYTYSYDESLSLHKNSQKELSFKMNRKILMQDNWINNPFVDNIHNGSLLLLTDKDDIEHLFIVKNINYDIKEINIVYTYQCQDAFTFQFSSQNEGYSIVNDINDENYIGALNIDEWCKKIIYDCYMHYEYIPLNIGIYSDNNHIMYQYQKNIQGEYVNLRSSNNIFTKEVKLFKQNIKNIYDDSIYHETLPFSISGSNAAGALIELANQTGFNIHTFEHLNEDNSLITAFWMEPLKKNNISGYKFSPNKDIQNFKFSQSGNSLTTVLNVQNNMVDNKLVSLIPEPPLFFIELFNSSQDWDKSAFSKNFFTNLCQSQHYIFSNNKIESSSNYELLNFVTIEGETKAKLINKKDSPNEPDYFTVPSFYHYFDFIADGQPSTYTNKNGVGFSTSGQWKIIFIIENNNGEQEEINVLPNEEIPNMLLGKSYGDIVYRTLILDKEKNTKEIKWKLIGAYIWLPSTQPISTWKIYLNFYRNATKEELEFANIADKCPWLENKIIDFKYFYDLNIINKFEYNTVNDLLQNRMRILNGKLLAKSKYYNNSFNEKVEILGNLKANLEKLGAECQSSLINSYAKNGEVTSIEKLQLRYDDVYKISYTDENNLKQEILNKDEILTDYFNKTFNANQRFLKNIYEFRQYFEAPLNMSNEKSQLFINTITAKSPQIPDQTTVIRTISFNKGNFTPTYENGDWNPNFKPFIDLNTGVISTLIYNKEKNIIETVNKENYNQYFVRADKDNLNYYQVASGPQQPKSSYYTKINDNKMKEISTLELKQAYLNNNNKNNKIYVKVPYYSTEDIFPKDEDLKKLKIEQPFEQECMFFLKDGILKPLNIVTPSNESKYYRRVIQFTKEKPKYNRGSRYTYEGAGRNRKMVPKTVLTGKIDFGLSGNCVFDVFNNKLTGFSNYSDQEAISYTTNPSFDLKSVTDLKNYENLQELGFTPKSFKTAMTTAKGLDGQLVIKYSQFNQIDINEIPKKGDKYYICSSKTEKEAEIIVPDSFNDIGGFFYINLFDELDIDPITIDGKTSLSTLLEKDGYNVQASSEDPKKYSLIIDGVESPLCKFYKESTMQLKSVQELKLKYDKDTPYYDALGNRIDLTKCDDFVDGYYTEADLEHSLISATSFDKDQQYYKKDINGKPFKVYTYKKLMEPNSNIDFLDSTIWEKASLTKIDQFTPQLFLQEINIEKNEEKNLSSIVSITNKPLSSNLILDFSQKKVGDSIDLNAYDESGYWYTNQFTWTDSSMPENWNLKEMSNGEFWYKLKLAEIQVEKNPDSALKSQVLLLKEKAMEIETELTKYWTEAFRASKLCQYFIPEFWQFSNGSTNNYFNKELFSVYNWEKDNVYKISINNKYIPEVKIFNIGNKMKTPGYYYKKNDFSLNKIKTTNPIVINNENLSALTLYEENPAIQDIFNDLAANPSDWIAVKNNDNINYYYITSGGMKWSNLALTLTNVNNFKELNGLYLEIFKIINTHYNDKSMEEYNSIKQEQLSLWRDIYTRFKGLLIERTYSNNAATNSHDLYNMAINYFRDMYYPEKQYDLSVIDVSQLNGYTGQILNIGDPIEINANEYYNEEDYIKTALQQLLFITDINYSLRKDSDIKVTVNSLKYEDKLTQNLVKLIKI